MIILENVSKVFRIPHERTKTLYHKLLSFTKAGYSYEDLYALKNINIHVKSGEFLGIIGRNGSGKSTLLRIIAGVYRPTGGKVIVNEEISPLLELGLGFDNSFSCRDNIYVYGALLGYSRKQMSVKVDEILAFAELERFADAKLDTLSSGMRVRLAFSIAIQSVAPVILVDEVLAVGDKVFAEKCRNVFRALQKEGRTIVFVSHDTTSIKEFCNRVIVIHQGEIVGDGEPTEMVEFYNKRVLPAIDTVVPYNAKTRSAVSVFEKSSDGDSPPQSLSQVKVEAVIEKPVVKKSNGYNLKEFWEKRLTDNFNLSGVGNISFDERYNEYLYHQRLTVLKKVLKKYKIILEGKKVLDVGCGIGYFTKFYLDRSAKVTGLDIAPVVIDRLKKSIPSAEFIRADISSADGRLKKMFDVIHSFNTIIHITDDEKFQTTLMHLCKMLKMGGYLFITDYFGKTDYAPAPHVKFRSLERYKMMKEHGVDILEVCPIHRFLNNKLKSSSIKIKPAVIPIFLLFDSVLNFMNIPGGFDLKLMIAKKVGGNKE
ncbi:MAG: ATP-binding cassette domain-containing protein [Bacteroidota bacterium]|nr:ATP-binding cassette domain-containing protein [Bacteroidota bacterium]